MKKNGIKMIAIAALSLIGISSAFAFIGEEDRWYIAGTGALVFKNKNKAFVDANNGMENKYKLGWGTSVAVGRTIDCWRAEVELAYRRNKVKDYNVVENGTKNPVKAGAYSRDIAIMANVYYDLPVCNCLSVYIGAGAGVSFNEFAVEQDVGQGGNVSYSHRLYASQKNTLFAWQVMTGVAYDLSENWAITLGYRLFATMKPKYQLDNKVVKAKKIPFSNNIELGLRYKF